MGHRPAACITIFVKLNELTRYRMNNLKNMIYKFLTVELFRAMIEFTNCKISIA
jgi:hypothetical protein